MSRRLPAEWEPLAGVLMAWPHDTAIWENEQPYAHVVEGWLALAAEVARRVPLIVAGASRGTLAARFVKAGIDPGQCHFGDVPLNDCWIRDFGPLTVEAEDGPRLLDFAYNGWGLKYPADLDNLATRRLRSAGLFGQTPVDTVGLVLEGGSVESDGRGNLLTTTRCLQSPNRNPQLTRRELDGCLQELLGVTTVHWLAHGELLGDDTDAHVDLLARFAPQDVILYTACDEVDYPHFASLTALRRQLESLAGFTAVPLPWPPPITTDTGRRLPASYANFLVLPGAVLVPTYGCATDEAALTTVGEAFPGREAIGVDARALLHQGGALHCATMQIPAGVSLSRCAGRSMA